MKVVRPNNSGSFSLKSLIPWVKYAPLLSLILAIGIQLNYKTTVCDIWNETDCVHNVGLVSDRQNLIMIVLSAGVMTALISRKG